MKRSPKFHQVWKEENYKWPRFLQWEIPGGSPKYGRMLFKILKETFMCNL